METSCKSRGDALPAMPSSYYFVAEIPVPLQASPQVSLLSSGHAGAEVATSVVPEADVASLTSSASGVRSVADDPAVLCVGELSERGGAPVLADPAVLCVGRTVNRGGRCNTDHIVCSARRWSRRFRRKRYRAR